MKPGEQFNGRGELAALGIHQNIGGGIYCLKDMPCFAIAISGGYKDDADEAAALWYTGQGSQNPRTKDQHKNQELTKVRQAAVMRTR